MTFAAYLARHNLFVDLDRLISEKGRVTSSHFIDKDSKCPPIHSFVVALEETETEKNIFKSCRLIFWFNLYYTKPLKK